MKQISRLDKFIANNSIYSRRQVKKLLQQGRVKLDNALVKDGALKLLAGQKVELDGKQLLDFGAIYLMLNKPLGVISATVDSQQPTVLGLIDEPYAKKLHLVGRLDKQTSGLLLLSNDGAFSAKICAPNSGFYKTYIVHTARDIKPDYEAQFAGGILLRNETTATRAAIFKQLAPRIAKLSIAEGRYHQVRRMFAAVGNHVLALKRVQIGNLKLDPSLKQGQYRPLSKQELQAFNSSSQLKTRQL